MKRNFLFRFLICLVPTVLAGVFVGMASYKESQGQPGFRRGIDLAGGTILVYEVAIKPGQEGLNSDQIRELAENLKRRIDPNDLKNIVVRPVGTSRIEIILPYSASVGGKEGTTENEIQEVKNLVSQAGVLEFRILANDVDDAQGIRQAKALLESGRTDPDVKKQLDLRAADGRPPTAPEGTYSVMGNDVSYEWVPLSKAEMESHLLKRDKRKIIVDSAGNPAKSGLWEAMRSKPGEVLVSGGANEKNQSSSYAIYRRPFTKSTPAKKEEWKVGHSEYFVLARVSTQDSLKVTRDVGLKASVESDPNSLSPSVGFTLNGTGARRMGEMTERNRPTAMNLRNMAIIMDGDIVSMPTLNGILRERGQITGSFDIDSVKQLVRILQSGALNAELKPDPVSENTVGPTLGQDTIRKGLEAVGFAFGAILLFMVVYYRFSGVVACVALLVNLLMTVGFMAAVNAAFTLPGLAGVVLMLGMAVDANVLIYERIREEREKGANLVTALRNGYDKAFGTIIDTHLTSIFTAIVLYAVGNDNLKGFAVSLTVGLIISLFTSLYMTRLMFDFAISRKAVGELKMMKLFGRPNFDFMKIRMPMFIATALLTLAGFVLFFFVRGEAGLNVDFTKGTAYGGRLKDGEARALSETSDGKLGLLDLMSEKRQADRLKVTDVVWRRPVADLDDPNAQNQQAEYIYEITYDDGDGKTSKATVTFANPPEGADEAAQRDDVIGRAKALPGLSVEQVFISTDPSYGSSKSRSFTVRTTEREPELVQIMLDRLLRDEKTGEQLMEATKATDVQVNGSTANITLDKPASPNYLKNFVTRELKMVGRVPAVGGAPAVEITGIPTEGETEELRAKRIEESRSGRYQRIRVDVSKNTQFRDMRAAEDLSNKLGGLAGGMAGASPAAVNDMNAFESSITSAVKSFEARPLPDRLETFDPALAADTRNRALLAVGLSWLAILAYLWFRFGSWTFGLAAVVCLIHDLCFTLGCIAACHYLHDTTFGRLLGLQDFKIDLTAVAALLTLVGYSVSDTIVVFDRIKEVRGKNPGLTPQMINDSVNGTLSRTVLASLTVFLVVGVLYIFGGEGVHLFSFTMVIGVIVGTYSSIYIASPMLLIFGEGHGRKAERTVVKPLEATIG